jgi:hypothetical protein
MTRVQTGDDQVSTPKMIVTAFAFHHHVPFRGGEDGSMVCWGCPAPSLQVRSHRAIPFNIQHTKPAGGQVQ